MERNGKGPDYVSPRILGSLRELLEVFQAAEGYHFRRRPARISNKRSLEGVAQSIHREESPQGSKYSFDT